MNDGVKLGQIVGVLAVGAVAFGLGILLMGGNKQPPPTQAVIAIPKEDAPFKLPEEVADPPSTKIAPAEAPPDNPRPFKAPPVDLAGRWASASGYGLPNPRKLTVQEKAALNLLGGAEDTHEYKFSRIVLDDGSTVPGVAPLSPAQIKELVLGKIREKGLGDGFEDAIRTLAVHNPNHLAVKVSREAEWSALEEHLGKKELTGSTSTAYYRQGGKTLVYNIRWVAFSWLQFGVDSGKVRLVRAYFPIGFPDLIAAESVPGGRSPPDPSKAKKSAKPRPPDAPPALVDALMRLGKVAELKVVPYPAIKRDPAVDALIRSANDAVGKPLYPDLVETARKFKGQKILHLFVTSSQRISLDELIDIVGDTRIRSDDSKTFPGTTVKWYSYSWIQFGIVDGQVTKVMVRCQSVPKQL